jgi:hypothetical protein
MHELGQPCSGRESGENGRYRDIGALLWFERERAIDWRRAMRLEPGGCVEGVEEPFAFIAA